MLWLTMGLDCYYFATMFMTIPTVLKPRVIFLLSLALLVTSGCHGTSVDDSEDPGPRPPGWLADLPERVIQASPGTVVWAVVPELGSEAARLGVYRLEAAAGNEAVLTDGIGNRYEGVPGALVHPLSDSAEAELKPGTAVLAGRWDASKVVGRVTGVDEGAVKLAYDWNGVTVTSGMEAVMALSAGEDSLALRWVGYRRGAGSAWHRGLCFAESGQQLWLSTDGGHVEIVDRNAVKPLTDTGRAELGAGDSVVAYTAGRGFLPGVVEEVLEPGLRYSVKLEDGETRSVFFDGLTTEPL